LPTFPSAYTCTRLIMYTNMYMHKYNIYAPSALGEHGPVGQILETWSTPLAYPFAFCACACVCAQMRDYETRTFYIQYSPLISSGIILYMYMYMYLSMDSDSVLAFG